MNNWKVTTRVPNGERRGPNGEIRTIIKNVVNEHGRIIRTNRRASGRILNKIRDALRCLNTGINHNGRWISIRHGDLHSKNILLSQDGNIVYIIDWGTQGNQAFINIKISDDPNRRNAPEVYSTDNPANYKHRWITSKYTTNNVNNRGAIYTTNQGVVLERNNNNRRGNNNNRRGNNNNN